jgi:hypothetical protein
MDQTWYTKQQNKKHKHAVYLLKEMEEVRQKKIKDSPPTWRVHQHKLHKSMIHDFFDICLRISNPIIIGQGISKQKEDMLK